MNIIEAKNLNFSYTSQQVINNLSFSIEKGLLTAITGPNGAGKSTLLALLSKKLEPKKGAVLIQSKNINTYNKTALAKMIAHVKQEHIPVFGFSVIQTVLMARTPYFKRLGFESKEDRIIAQKALHDTETEHLAERPLQNLSGGERQRVYIARALAQNTDIILLDEPTSFLDLKHQVKIYELLKSLQKNRNKTIITISHDLNLTRQYADQVLLLANNTDYFFGKPETVLTTQKIKQVFDVDGCDLNMKNQQFFIPLGKMAKDFRQI